MMRKIIFLLVMLAYIAFPLYTISSYEKVLTEGEVFRFDLIPVDPYDAFRGKYITLRFPRTQLPADSAKLIRGQQIYVAVSTDSTGLALFDNWSFDPPAHPNYLTTTVKNAYNNKVYINVPFDRYYLNEELAPLAESHYNKLASERRDSIPNIYLDVRISKGKSVIEDLYFEGQKISSYLRQVQLEEDYK